MAQLVKHLSAFRSGHDLWILGLSPTSWAPDSAGCLLLLPLPLPLPLLMLSHSLRTVSNV